jgi:hypothetical protein
MYAGVLSLNYLVDEQDFDLEGNTGEKVRRLRENREEVFMWPAKHILQYFQTTAVSPFPTQSFALI